MAANLDRFDATGELGEVVLTGDWQDYYIESDLLSEFVADPVTGVVQALPEFIPMFPLPDQAIRLADERVALPYVQLVPPDAYPHSLGDADHIMIWWIPVHVLTQDPAQDGQWVVDETLTMCMGDCDLARANIVDYIDSLDSLVPDSDDATPTATAQTRCEGQTAWRNS